MKKILLSLALIPFVAGPLGAAPKPKAGNPGMPGQAFRQKAMKDPKVKAAQEKVWDARLALYAARHERALAGIAFAKAQVEKNDPENKKEKLEALDEAKADADKAYDLGKKLVAAERVGDMEKVRTINMDLRKMRMGRRGDRKSRMDERKGKKGLAGDDGVPRWGDEGME